MLGCRFWSSSILVKRKHWMALFLSDCRFFASIRWCLDDEIEHDEIIWQLNFFQIILRFWYFAFSWIYLQSLDVFWYLLQPKGDSIKWLNLNKLCGKKALNNIFFSRTVVCFAFIRWSLDDEIEPDEIIWQLNIIWGIFCVLKVSLVLPFIVWCLVFFSIRTMLGCRGWSWSILVTRKRLLALFSVSRFFRTSIR